MIRVQPATKHNGTLGTHIYFQRYNDVRATWTFKPTYLSNSQTATRTKQKSKPPYQQKPLRRREQNRVTDRTKTLRQTQGRTNRQTGKAPDEQTDRQTQAAGQTSGQTDGVINRQTHRRINKVTGLRTDKQTQKVVCMSIFVRFDTSLLRTSTDGQTARRIDRLTDRQTNR